MADFIFFIEGLPLDFFNPRSVIVFIAILQGAIFAALLLFRFYKQRKKADFWLAALLIFLCFGLITPLIGFANVYDRNQWLTFFPFNVPYIYAVCIWFYVLNLTDSKRRFQRKDLWLFVPSVVFLLFRFFLFAQDLEFKVWFSTNYYSLYIAPTIFVTELIWNLIFAFLLLKHYRKYRVWLDENYSDTEKIKFDWLKIFLYLFAFVLILEAIFDFTGSFIVPLSYRQIFYFEFVVAALIYFLAIAGYMRSQVFEIEFSENEKDETEQKKTLLSDAELEKFKIKLQNLMHDEKPYLENELTLGELAKMLGVNSAVLSFAINNGFGKNFNDFINERRIAEVEEKLKKSDDSTILEIAFECGFNSKATFNRAFKKFNGISPKEYLEKYEKS